MLRLLTSGGRDPLPIFSGIRARAEDYQIAIDGLQESPCGQDGKIQYSVGNWNPPETLPEPYSEYEKQKISHSFTSRKGNYHVLKISEHSVHEEACLLEKLFH